MRDRISGDYPEAELTPLTVQLADNLFAVCFCLMKLLPARHILESAMADGRLKPGAMVVETTSGTFGLALALCCRIMGLRLTLVSDPAIQPDLHQRLMNLGAVVEVVDRPAPGGGYQIPRLQRVGELLNEIPDSFCPLQYDNPGNPESYWRLAAHISEVIGPVDCLVGAVGSGGSMCGTARYLREINPDLRAVGVDTHRSVLFGQPDGERRLRGLGNSLMPENLDHTAFDEVHWIGAAEAFRATRRLEADHAMYCGPTSGAAWMAALWWAQRHPDRRAVVIMADEGYRYRAECFDDDWLRGNGLWLEEIPAAPVTIVDPAEEQAAWSRFAWGRRTYEAIMGRPFGATR
jgi:cysteine synthase A